MNDIMRFSNQEEEQQMTDISGEDLMRDIEGMLMNFRVYHAIVNTSYR